jgi:hypothetical protein
MSRSHAYSPIENRPSVVDPPSGCQELALGTDVDVAFLVEREVGAREGAVVASTLVPNGNVRRDARSNHPTEELAGAIRRVSGEPA